MATKKNPATEEQLLEQQAEEAKPEESAKLKAQQAEIEKLKAQIAAMQARPAAQNDAEAVKAACREAAEKGVDPWDIIIYSYPTKKSASTYSKCPVLSSVLFLKTWKNVIGPNLPKNMMMHKTILLPFESSGVTFALKPTVPNAENTSKNIPSN